MKKYLLSLIVFINFTTNAQTTTNEKFNYILRQFSSCALLHVYLYKTDTLVKCVEVKNKPAKRKQSDMMGSIAYYSSNGEIKYEAKIGSIAGFRKSAAFVQMESELVLLATLNNTNTISNIPVKKDAVINKVFSPAGTEIYFYDQPNFKGRQLMINAEGDFDLVAARPTWNNAISSIQIPNGYFVTLYDTNPYAGGELATYLEIGSKKNKPLTIPDCKKLPTYNYVTANTPDYSATKIKIINFDKKTSYILVSKIK
jgi:hypothetical protein